MAPKNTKKAPTMKMPAAPKGWKEARTNLAGWFCRKPGNTVVGTLRGSFEVDDRFNKGKKKKVYRIEVIEEPLPFIGDAESGEVANVGDVIGLDETGWTSKLADYEPGQAVYIRYVGKPDPDDEKSPHIFQIYTPEE